MKRVAAVVLLTLLMLGVCACTDQPAQNGEESTGGENMVEMPNDWAGGSEGDTSEPSGTQPEEVTTAPSGDRWTNFY